MPKEQSEKERLRGEGFGKPFSKKWWENFWYYYKKAVFIGICVLIVAGVTIHEAATKVHPDAIVDYIGYQYFTHQQLDDWQKYLVKLSADVTGNKKVEVLLNHDSFSPQKAATDQSMSNALETINLDFSVGDQVIYFMDRNSFDYFAGQSNDYFMDIRKLASECHIPNSKIVSVKGHIVGIDVTGSGMLKSCNIVLKSNAKVKDNDLYMVIRKERIGEKNRKKDSANYQNSMNMAKKILATMK